MNFKKGVRVVVNLGNTKEPSYYAGTIARAKPSSGSVVISFDDGDEAEVVAKVGKLGIVGQAVAKTRKSEIPASQLAKWVIGFEPVSKKPAVKPTGKSNKAPVKPSKALDDSLNLIKNIPSGKAGHQPGPSGKTGAKTGGHTGPANDLDKLAASSKPDPMEAGKLAAAVWKAARKSTFAEQLKAYTKASQNMMTASEIGDQVGYRKASGDAIQAISEVADILSAEVDDPVVDMIESFTTDLKKVNAFFVGLAGSGSPVASIKQASVNKSIK